MASTNRGGPSGSALESRQAAQNSIAQAQIIDSAEPPQSPSWPNRPLLIEPSGLQGLDQIIIHKPYFSSENLFGNDLMPKILEQLSERYDTIILDLPPLVGLADGRFLAALADAVALVIRWNNTPKHAVTSAAAWLKSDGANLVGSMFTMVDTSSQAVGSYYYYSKQYSEYYQEA